MRTWTGRVAVGYDGTAAGRDALVLGELLARTVGGELLAVRVQPKRTQRAAIDTLEGEPAAALASNLAAAAQATLRVIAVGARPPESPEAAAAAAGGQARHLQSEVHDAVAALPDDLRALPVYERGDVARSLLEHADQGVDLLVVGSRGRGPVGSVLLGSTSAAVIAASPCPVVVVPRPALATDPNTAVTSGDRR